MYRPLPSAATLPPSESMAASVGKPPARGADCDEVGTVAMGLGGIGVDATGAAGGAGRGIGVAVGVGRIGVAVGGSGGIVETSGGCGSGGIVETGGCCRTTADATAAHAGAA